MLADCPFCAFLLNPLFYIFTINKKHLYFFLGFCYNNIKVKKGELLW
jgi:hypothetical protein